MNQNRAERVLPERRKKVIQVLRRAMSSGVSDLMKHSGRE